MSTPLTFVERARRATSDPQFQAVLAYATSKYVSHRLHAFAELPDAERLRDRGKEIRARTLAHLDEHLAEFADKVERAGGVVHWAKDAAEACEIVVKIAQARGVKLVTKVKSMVGEEIEINAALEHAGITPVETDLGEWIVQLAHERPSHLIAPAFHKTKEQVAELFSNVVGHPVPPEIGGLVKIAQKELRAKFLAAQMGISGVNFGIAETGTMLIVTNEGNGRLTTGLPPIHVALMGIEKVVPTWDDAAALLGLLARSGTGQKSTTYVTMITGPKRANDADGPSEFHLVLIDNGRTKMLAGEFREALQCIRCGACLNICPVYGHIGGHGYGWVYGGPIGAVLTPNYAGLREYRDLPHASSLCEACRDVCPVRIDIPRMLIALRGVEVTRGVTSAFERALFRLTRWVLANPLIFRLSARAGRWGLMPFMRNGRVPKMPLFFGRWTDSRDFPIIAAQTFHARWRELKNKKPDEGDR